MASKSENNKTARQYIKNYTHQLCTILLKKLRWAVQVANEHANFITAIATVSITVLTFVVIKISHQQVTDSRAIQRAFVNIVSNRINRVLDPQGKEVEQFQVIMIWENSGSTPTRNMIMHENFEALKTAIPEGFLYIDHWDSDAKPRVHIRTVLGPKQSRWGPPLKIKPQTVRDVIDQKLRLYFYGWARYNDVFDGTREHLMEFCRELIFDGGAPFDPTADFNHRMIDCPNHNCTDEECADYKQATAQ